MAEQDIRERCAQSAHDPSQLELLAAVIQFGLGQGAALRQGWFCD